MNKFILIGIILLFSAQHSIAQLNAVDPLTFDYSKADSLALTLPKKNYKTTAELVASLLGNTNTEHERVRIIYRWITDNIAYSYRNRTANAQKALKTRRAVCAGYAALFKDMLNQAGIANEMIVGYTKTDAALIGKNLDRTKHAWSAVKIYEKWYLIDITWASGYYKNGKNKFVKDHDETYYLTPPEDFIKQHFPTEPKWQLLEKPLTKKEFIKMPVYYSAWIKNDIEHIQKDNGIIHSRMKKAVDFNFTSARSLGRFHIAVNKNEPIASYVERDKDNYRLTYKFNNPGSYTVTVYCDGQSIATYRVHVYRFGRRSPWFS